MWSVNWRFLPSAVFTHRAFPAGLLLLHLVLLAALAHWRWIPGGMLSADLWTWRQDPRRQANWAPLRTVLLLFACNFVGVACLRTMHFQFLVWYAHSLPLLCWWALDVEGAATAWAWAARAAATAALCLSVEVSFLLTTTGVARGPDGSEWNTVGVPTTAGSMLLTAAHAGVLTLLAFRTLPARGKSE